MFQAISFRKLPLTALMMAGVLAIPSLGCSAPAGGEDKAFGDKVRAYLLAHPEVISEAMDKLQAKQAADKDAATKAAIATRRDALEHNPLDLVAGNPKGPITVVEFFDYRCPFCKAAEPELQKLLETNKDVRLVLKEFPILDVEDQSHISEDAARAALAAKDTGKYLQLHEAFLKERHLDEPAISRVLKEHGIDPERDRTQGASKTITDHLQANRTLARELSIDGTPTFIVGDRMIDGARMDQLTDAIAAARKAGDKRG